MWGVIITLLLLPLIAIIKLDNKPIDDIKIWLWQVQQKPEEIGLHIFYALCTVITSYTGLSISAYLSSAARGTMDAVRIIIIWAVNMIVGWEVWNNVSTPVRFIGFILIVFGVLIYNNAFKIIPFLRQINIQLYGKWMGRKKQTFEDITQDDVRKPVINDVSESTDLKGSTSFTAQNSAQIGKARI